MGVPSQQKAGLPSLPLLVLFSFSLFLLPRPTIATPVPMPSYHGCKSPASTFNDTNSVTCQAIDSGSYYPHSRSKRQDNGNHIAGGGQGSVAYSGSVSGCTVVLYSDVQCSVEGKVGKVSDDDGMNVAWCSAAEKEAGEDEDEDDYDKAKRDYDGKNKKKKKVDDKDAKDEDEEDKDKMGKGNKEKDSKGKNKDNKGKDSKKKDSKDKNDKDEDDKDDKDGDKDDKDKNKDD
ncbi:hypothetical protein BJX99DRAFT_260861, partial [Aspergillus californicus]